MSLGLERPKNACCLSCHQDFIVGQRKSIDPYIIRLDLDGKVSQSLAGFRRHQRTCKGPRLNLERGSGRGKWVLSFCTCKEELLWPVSPSMKLAWELRQLTVPTAPSASAFATRWAAAEIVLTSALHRFTTFKMHRQAVQDDPHS